jgi:acyl-phosphate glycerol 3-phosphate acyltransferase
MTASVTWVIFTCLAAYLVGAIPFGYLIARARGVDILHQGSGNIGATNVGRVLGRPFGFLVFLLDFAKGALPVAAAAWMAAEASSGAVDDLQVAAGLTAFLGHLFPIYLRFRGGKGVATGAGVVTVLLPMPAVGALLTWAAVVCLTRYVSLASLAAVSVLCALRLTLTTEPFAPDQRVRTLFCFVVAALVFLRHRANINRLLHGNENRLQESAAMLALSKTLHVLALGLWFGSSVFFSLVATPVIFQTFAALAEQPHAARPAWLPPSFTRENATQLAGLAVGPIFAWYFLLEGVCGLLTAVTALAWLRAAPRSGVHKLRFYVLAAALTTVLLSWPIAHQVSILRAARYGPDPTLAETARAQFAEWHLYSLGLNLITLALVTVAMALAAHLPTAASSVEQADVGSRRSDPKTAQPF